MAEKPVAWKYLGLEEKIEYLKSHKSDCTLVVGNVPDTKKFSAHSFVLKSVSEVFERMLNGVFTEATTPHEIKITDLEPCDFKPFLEFIYFNNGDIKYCPIKTWIKLIYIGKKYMVQELSDTCNSFLQNEVTPNSILRCYDLISIFACAHLHNNQGLINLCNGEIRDPMYKMRLCTELQQLSFIFDLDSSVFFNLMVVIKEQVSSSKMFFLIESFAKLNSLETAISSNESVNTYLTMMLNLIDYRNMTLKEFYDGPAQSSVIKMELYEKYNMIVYLCKKNDII